MAKIELRLDYLGDISNPANTKQDFRKAMRIIGFSVISSVVLTIGLFLVLFFLFP